MNEDFLNQPAQEFEEVLVEVSSKYSGPCSIQDLEDIVNNMLATLPRINRDKLRKEINDMEVPMFETPTTFDINNGLAKAQGYKDRLTEIYMIAQRDYKLRKRCVEMLFDAFNVVSKASSFDKRKGEATMKYPVLLLQLEASESFLDEVQQYMNNLKSASDSISRQGSLIQTQVSLGEYRKRGTSGFNNESPINKSSDAEDWDYHTDSKKLKTNLDWDEIR